MLHPRAIIQRSCDVVVHVQLRPLASLSNPRSFDARTYPLYVCMYVRDFDSPFRDLSFFAPTRSKSFRTTRMAARDPPTRCPLDLFNAVGKNKADASVPGYAAPTESITTRSPPLPLPPTRRTRDKNAVKFLFVSSYGFHSARFISGRSMEIPRSSSTLCAFSENFEDTLYRSYVIYEILPAKIRNKMHGTRT